MNILLITTDQHQRTTLGSYGADICQTPHLDRLANEGTRFTQAYTNTAICTPARTSMLSGYLPFRHGMLANFERNVGYPLEIPDGFPLLPHYLPNHRCINEGKWHIGKERGPDYYNFEGDHFAGWHPPYSHPTYVDYLKENNLPEFSVRNEVRGTFQNGKAAITQMGVHDAPDEATFPYFLAEQTIQRLKNAGDKPFVIATQFFGPHLPYFIPEKYLTMYDPNLVQAHPSMAETFSGKPAVHKRYSEHWAFDSYEWETWQKIVAAYWGYVTMIDEQIGRILNTLDETGLSDNTVVMFTSDHGGFVGNHRLADKGPAMYDDIYRIPMIVRSPEQAPAVCDRFVTLMDLMPTIIELAGETVPDGLDAKSIVSLLNDPEASWDEAVFSEFHGHHFPYPQRMIRTNTHKLVVNPADVNELYDLENDPFELNNVYEHPSYANIKTDLMTCLYNRLVNIGDNFHHWLPTMFDINAEEKSNQGLVR
ncbi:MAG: sulfatase-like hydrolase/transferase [Phototrophicaceae bacterium]